MNTILICPNCRDLLDEETDYYICNNCNRNYTTKDNYVDFIPDIDFYAGEVPQFEMKELINTIDNTDFDAALRIFLDKFPFLYQYITDNKRADWVYHCLGKNNSRCLDIGSGLGNISERLSYLYDEVYSVEPV